MEKILLFSDDEKLFEITKQVTEGKQELIWGNYQCLETNGYPFADVVIMHFDEEKIKKDIFQPIIKVKGRLDANPCCYRKWKYAGYFFSS